MSHNSIALTASMRSNLLSLKKTQSLTDDTQNKLSTGYAVNTAMDNPSSFFTARALNSRSNDLSTLIDGIGQAVSTLEVADEGIRVLQYLVQQAKTIATGARDTENIPSTAESDVTFDMDRLRINKISDILPGVDETSTMTIRVGDATKLTGTKNITEDNKIGTGGLGLSGASGSIKIGKEKYNLNVAAGANTMTLSYPANSVFKIAEIDPPTFTLEDVDGVKTVYPGTIPDLGAPNVHQAAVGDTVTNAADVTVTIDENGYSSYVSGFSLTTSGGRYAQPNPKGHITRTINISDIASVDQMSGTLESMIGRDRLDIAVEDGNLQIKTLDTSSVEVDGAFADVFGLDKGVKIESDDDETLLVSTLNVTAGTSLGPSGLNLPLGSFTGSIEVGGIPYTFYYGTAASNLNKRYNMGSVFRITEINAGSFTLEDYNGIRTTFSGTIPDLGAPNAHQVTVGDTVINNVDIASRRIYADGSVGGTGTFVLTTASNGSYISRAVSAQLPQNGTIYLDRYADVGVMAATINQIGSDKVYASVVNGHLRIKTLDGTPPVVTGDFASTFDFINGKKIDTPESLRQKIAGIDGVTAEFDENGKLIIKSENGDDLVISGDLADKLGVSGAATNGSNERASYARQFNDVLTQIDELVQDTTYKGVNLLSGDNLTVNFNESRTSSLELKGVNFDSVGLGFSQAADEWIRTDNVDKSLEQITKASRILRRQASEFGQNLSVVQNRKNFTENMINLLQAGADKLTMADVNEQGANMLALQTRQQLGINSLSLTSEASQNVLKLFS